MSHENVEIAGRFMPGPTIDLASLLRREATALAWQEAAAPSVSDDFECELTLSAGESASYAGIAGLREAWLKLIGPWHSYRSDVEELIDVDDRVLALTRDRGWPEFGPDEEEPEPEELRRAAIFTIRNGEIARLAFFADAEAGLAQLGEKSPGSP